MNKNNACVLMCSNTYEWLILYGFIDKYTNKQKTPFLWPNIVKAIENS